MARRKKTTISDNKTISDNVKGFTARRILDIVAVIFVVFAAMIAISLYSYDRNDPSINSSANVSDVTNYLGSKGAYLSDFIIQSVGYAGYLISAVFLIWGVRVYLRQVLRPMLIRVSALIISMTSLSIVLARFTSSDVVPHPYSGGSAGSIVLNSLSSSLSGIFGGWEHSVVAFIFAIIAIISFSFACAISKIEWSVAVQYTKYFVSSAYAFTYNNIYNFYEWVVHYNDPKYIQEKTARPIKVSAPLKPRKETKISAPLPANEEFNDYSDMDMKNIKVVNPRNTEQSSSVLSQSSFSLSNGEEWEFPPMDLLEEPPKHVIDTRVDEDTLRKNAQLLHSVLQDFNINGEIVSIHPGPVVTLYELEPAAGVKSSRVIGLVDDIARSMSAVSVRAAVIPGRNVIGIELPNKIRETVYMRDMVSTKEYIDTKARLPIILGKDISGKPIIADLAKMPHLLVAGTTGSGKSVAVNTMILSLLYKLPPEKCRFLMIDPKMLELSVYDDIPHLLSPVVTDPGKAVISLRWVVQEMENRYAAMSKLGVRNIEGYNDRMGEASKSGETLMRKVQTGFDIETGKPVFEEQILDLAELPYIVVVVDEFADLMMVAGKEVENAIQRLAQMARAAGIHIIMATQRPSVDVITGVIKANFPTRISFQVTSKIDSRTILGEGGAEQLLGMGDMLYMAGGGKIKRVHGPFAADDDVRKVVDHLKLQGEPSYLEEITDGSVGGDGSLGSEGANEDMDELYDQAVALIAREGKASTSFIQRFFKIGYNRAANIIEDMERQGVVGPANHVGKREILIQDHSDVA